MSFEAESNSELTVIVAAYQLHFRFSVQNKIHKDKILSDTRTGILGSIAGPCDFLPARSDEFQKVCDDISNTNIQPEQFSSSDHDGFLGGRKCNTGIKINFYRLVANWATREKSSSPDKKLIAQLVMKKIAF